MINIKLGLINIPIMILNFWKDNGYKENFHLFSRCCKEGIRYKKVCKKCGKEVLNDEILKGFDKEHILDKEQEEFIKNYFENNGEIKIYSIKRINENFLDFNIFIKKSWLVLPSINKGFKKSDIKTFYAFKNAIEQEKLICIGKYIQRNKEHLVLIYVLNNRMIMLEIPFKNKIDYETINRLEESVKMEIENIKNLDEYTRDAKEYMQKFINNDDKKEIFDIIKEEKRVLLQKIIEQIENRNINKVEVELGGEGEENPFKIK